MYFKETIEIKEVTFRGFDGNNFICDIEWEKPKREKRLVEVDGTSVLKTVTCYSEDKDVKIKMDTSNPNLLEKVRELKNRDIIYIQFRIPKNSYRYKTEDWEILDVLDDLDLLEISEQNCLIKGDIPKRERIIQPRRKTKDKNPSKKDIKIAKLEEENTQLKSQIQLLQKQLQDSKS